MKQQDLIKHIRQASGVTVAQANAMLRATFDCIAADMLENNGATSIPNFGTFSMTKTNARAYSNPRTHERIEKPAGRKIKFTPSNTLKRQL